MPQLPRFLLLAPLMLSGCATSNSCISPEEALKPISFASDAAAEAFYALPALWGTEVDYKTRAATIISDSKSAIATFNLTPKEETAFLRRSLRANELLFNQTEAKADLQRLITLGNLYNNEASYLSAKLDNLNRPSIEKYDRDAEALVRIPPIMSRSALDGNKSGHCALKFDVSATGRTENIEVGYCTRDYFRQSSVKSLAKWRYNPAIRNGVAVPRANVHTTIAFRIQDACGNTLPE